MNRSKGSKAMVLCLMLAGCGSSGEGRVAEACQRTVERVGLESSQTETQCGCVGRVATQYLDPENHRLLDRIAAIYLSPEPASAKFQHLASVLHNTNPTTEHILFSALDFVSMSHKIERLCGQR
jgi:hypothetical protein